MGGLNVNCVCDQNLGPEKGRELRGPPDMGVKPWPLRAGWEATRSPPVTFEDSLGLLPPPL